MSGISESRRELIKQILFCAADDDYICARLSARNALFRHFAWNSGQALEKYTKCLIVLNGGNAKFGHNFCEKLQEQANENFAGMFPEFIDLSDTTKLRANLEKYSTEPFWECVKRFEEMSNTSARYKTKSTAVRPYDLQKLDKIVFLLRRLCVAASEITSDPDVRRKYENDFNHTTATHWPTAIHSAEVYDRKREALEFENVANFPDTYERSNGWYFGSWDSAPHEAYKARPNVPAEDMKWLRETIRL